MPNRALPLKPMPPAVRDECVHVGCAHLCATLPRNSRSRGRFDCLSGKSGIHLAECYRGISCSQAESSLWLRLYKKCTIIRASVMTSRVSYSRQFVFCFERGTDSTILCAATIALACVCGPAPKSRYACALQQAPRPKSCHTVAMPPLFRRQGGDGALLQVIG